MAKAQYQRRWRQNSGKKPVQVYLHEDTLAQLDALASERGQSRAQVLTDLIGTVATASEPDAAARDDDTRDMFGDEVGEATEATQAGSEAQTPPPESARPRPNYHATRKQVLAGKGHQWVDAYRVTARRIELGEVWPDPANGRWKAVAVDDPGYVHARETTRRAATRRLLDYAMRQGWI